ncbi:hypothetical protein EBO15_17475 [Actinomadura harenae]|uniref:Uncharacterized protein n=1 Tax=Actinomadura harenae TaxID=2483351 RepID=A0A3M2LZY9_9ACTN|nr:hypothetical protein EBO15_17475 [Actinomadura harenae]
MCDTPKGGGALGSTAPKSGSAGSEGMKAMGYRRRDRAPGEPRAGITSGVQKRDMESESVQVNEVLPSTDDRQAIGDGPSDAIVRAPRFRPNTGQCRTSR